MVSVVWTRQARHVQCPNTLFQFLRKIILYKSPKKNPTLNQLNLSVISSLFMARSPACACFPCFLAEEYRKSNNKLKAFNAVPFVPKQHPISQFQHISLAELFKVFSFTSLSIPFVIDFFPLRQRYFFLSCSHLHSHPFCLSLQNSLSLRQNFLSGSTMIAKLP